MGMRVLMGAVASALALMLWSFMFWVVLAAPGGSLLRVPDEQAFLATLKDKLPLSGSYVFPLPPTAEPGRDPGPALEAFRQRQISGPMGMLHFNRRGADPLSPITYGRGFIHLFAASLIAALLLRMALPALETYLHRAAFVTGLGIFAAVAVRCYDPIWWHLNWGFFLHAAFYDVTAWLVSGLVLAGIVQPPRGVPHLTDPSKPLWKRALDVD
jgi:hypothetical protein